MDFASSQGAAVGLMNARPSPYGSLYGAENPIEDPSRFGRKVDLTAADEMTASNLVALCQKRDGYESPELNDQLLLNFNGFSRIPAGVLAPYVNCKSLFFEANGLTQIEHLDELPNLCCLYLQQNSIERLENLTCLQHLLVLNLWNNRIRHIPKQSLPGTLEQLNLRSNLIDSVEALEGVLDCRQLKSVDVSHNLIEKEDGLLEFWTPLTLDCLFLHHNPIVRHIKNYRRRLVSQMPTLRFLDDRPVSAIERCGAEGWANGENEQDVKRLFWEQDAAEKRKSFGNFRRIQEAAGRRSLRRAELEQQAEDARRAREEEIERQAVAAALLAEEATAGSTTETEQTPAATDVPEDLNCATDSVANGSAAEGASEEGNLALATVHANVFHPQSPSDCRPARLLVRNELEALD